MLGRYTTGPRQGADHSSRPLKPPTHGTAPTALADTARTDPKRAMFHLRILGPRPRSRDKPAAWRMVDGAAETGRMTLSAVPGAREASLREWRGLATRLQ